MKETLWVRIDRLLDESPLVRLKVSSPEEGMKIRRTLANSFYGKKFIVALRDDGLTLYVWRRNNPAIPTIEAAADGTR